MSDLLERLSNESPSELQRRTEESMKWFTSKMRAIRTRPESFFKKTNLSKTRQYLDGRMYMFFYEAKWQDKLPYWDAFPCTIILELYQNGFLGLNLHYIPPKMRAVFLDEAFEYVVADGSETERFNLKYDIIKASARLKNGKACIKRYLFSQMKSAALEVEPEYWDIATMLPVAEFKKQRVIEVYKDSREINR